MSGAEREWVCSASWGCGGGPMTDLGLPGRCDTCGSRGRWLVTRDADPTRAARVSAWTVTAEERVGRRE